jgi:hypothetical protein
MLGDKCLSYCTVRNWVARFGKEYLDTEYQDHSKRQTQVTIAENINAIYSMILVSQRMSIKNIRDRGVVPRKKRLYYSQDLRHKEVLRQMGFQMSQFC